MQLNHKEFFNSMAEKWDEMCSHDEDKLKAIAEMACIPRGGSVLDVGTGTGVMLPFIHSYTGSEGKITALDIAEKMLEVAAEKYPYDNIEYTLGDISEICFPLSTYDVIMCYSVFPHFKDKQGILVKLATLLKPGGRVVIAHSQSREAINSIHRQSSKSVSEDDLPEAAAIESYFLDAGLSPIKTIDNKEMFVLIGERSL